jgi:hypothetical protein
METYCIVYRLHKDNSPTVINCSTEKEQDDMLIKIKKDGYKNAYKATKSQATDVLNNYGKQFEPRPLTRQEIWNNWALGK